MPSDYGIVLEVIEIEHDYVFIDQKIRCYNYVIYWFINQTTETLPDIIIEKFSIMDSGKSNIEVGTPKIDNVQYWSSPFEN